MIKPVDWLWRQLNGPQITVIVKCLFNYIVAEFDALLDYWNNLSLDTMTDEHLTMAGLASGLGRPLVEIGEAAPFWFTVAPQHNIDYGFESDPPGIGGQLGAPYESRRSELLPETYFRMELQCASRDPGIPGSLAFLDNFTHRMYQRFSGHPENEDYRIYFEDGTVAGRGAGDIDVQLGERVQWRIPIDIIHIYEGIATSAYGPVQHILVTYTDA